MRRIFAIVAVVVLTSAFTPEYSITDKERKFALDYFRKTRQFLLENVAALSDAQLNWKPADSVWSVANCLEHIAKAEQLIFDLVQASLKDAADPSKRSEIKMTDQEVIDRLTNRSRKATAPEPIRPNNEFGTVEATLEAYKTRRENLINYMKKTEDDLRNHFVALPFGTIDAYQGLLFLAAHSERHTLQIQELKANPSFPKK